MCPIYEFECKKCNTHEEVLLLNRSEEEEVFCKECNEKMEKVLSRGSFVLKGGGWYRDGYSKVQKGVKK